MAISTVVLLFLVGCATTGNESCLDIDNVSRNIIPGKTTKQQVIDLLGQPLSKDMSSDGKEVWLYTDSNVNEVNNKSLAKGFIGPALAVFVPGGFYLNSGMAIAQSTDLPEYEYTSIFITFRNNIVESCGDSDNSIANTATNPFISQQDSSSTTYAPATIHTAKTNSASTHKTTSQETDDIKKNLLALKELRDSGIVTDAEYEERRAILIERLFLITESNAVPVESAALHQDGATHMTNNIEVAPSENMLSFTIIGEVRSPGTYNHIGEINLHDALINAGGFTKYASGILTIQRGKEKKTFSGGFKKKSVSSYLIIDGDIIEVARSKW